VPLDGFNGGFDIFGRLTRRTPVDVRRIHAVRHTAYIPSALYNEMVKEAARQDRSLSWVMTNAWRIAKPVFMKWPGRL